MRWGADPEYSSQVNYNKNTPCLLECRPPQGPDQEIAPGGSFESIRAFELAHDSTERERKGLAQRRMYRTIAPWVTENPVLMHVRSARPDAVKTGMLFSSRLIQAVVTILKSYPRLPLVVDPVMVATSGAPLLKKDAVAILQRLLFPQAAVVTPNCVEAAVLWGREIRTLADLRAAAQALSGRFGVPFLVKGGHLPVRNQVVDVLCDGRVTHEFSAQVVHGIRAHGAGCTFSAAITANLALGHDLPTAVRRAKRFITRAFRNAVRVGNCRALMV